MYNDEEFFKRIADAVTNNDIEEMKTIIEDISKDFNYSKFNWIEELFLRKDLDDSIKFKFLLNAIKIREDIDESEKNLFHRQVIPHLLSICIQGNEDEFVEVVTKDVQMQEMLVSFIKQEPVDSIQIWHRISNLPLIKAEILEDEDFISNELRNEGEFFENLPQEYANLICYYNATLNDMEFMYMQFLYEKYFENVLSEEERTELIALHYYNAKISNGMGVSSNQAMQPLNSVLKGILNDSSYFNKIRDFQSKFDMDFISTAMFSFKYNNIYRELLEEGKSNDIIREKIMYLSKADKIVGINALEDINNRSLNELRNMETETIYVSELVSTGGPQSKTRNSIFPDSSYREVRRIDSNGDTKKIVLGNQESHEDAVKEIYEGDVMFSNDCRTAWQRSVESAKQISAVTLVIENEQCHMYIPSNISTKQIEKSIYLIDSAIDNGEFGIAVYDCQKDKTYIAGMNLLNKDGAKGFLLRFNERIMQNDIESESLISTSSGARKEKADRDD